METVVQTEGKYHKPDIGAVKESPADSPEKGKR
jgi:hypothetical protein